MDNQPSKTSAVAPDADITVMVLSRMPSREAIRRFGRQLPASGRLKNCRFVFDSAIEDYDWLVVYHDIYHQHGAGTGMERLRCSRANTILITAEPSTITVYGTDYLRQYGTVITSQEPWVIKHPEAVFTQPGLLWYYGMPFGEGVTRSYDDLRASSPPSRTS